MRRAISERLRNHQTMSTLLDYLLCMSLQNAVGGEHDMFPSADGSKKSSLRSSASGKAGTSHDEKGASPGKSSIRSSGISKAGTSGGEKEASPGKSSLRGSGIGKVMSGGEKEASPGKGSLRSSGSGKERTSDGEKGTSPGKSPLRGSASGRAGTSHDEKGASLGKSSIRSSGISKAGTSGGEKEASPGKSSLRSSGIGQEVMSGGEKEVSPGKGSLRSSGTCKERTSDGEKGTSPGKSPLRGSGSGKEGTSGGDKSASPGKSSLRSSGSYREKTPGVDKAASPIKSSLRSSASGKYGTSRDDKGASPGKSSLRSSCEGREGTPVGEKGVFPGSKKSSLRSSGSVKEGAYGSYKGTSPGSKKSSLRSSGSGKVAPAPEQMVIVKETSDLPQVVEESVEQMAIVELQVCSAPENEQAPPSLEGSEIMLALPAIEERSALTEPLLMLGYDPVTEVDPGLLKASSLRSSKDRVTGAEEPPPLADKVTWQDGAKISSPLGATSPGAPPAKGGRPPLPVIALAAFVVVIVGILILMVLTRSQKSPAQGGDGAGSDGLGMCQSKQCAYVASLLLESVSEDSKPCEDFYQYVCGNWKHKASQSEVLFQKLVEEVTNLSRSVPVPSSGQTAAQKAALAYQTCEDIVAKNNTSLTTVMRILEEAGLYSPPAWTGPFDALNTTLYLGVRWSIPAPVKLTYAQRTYRGITVRMAPSESLKAYVRRRQEPRFYAKLKDDYETLNVTNIDPKMDFKAWMHIDKDVVGETQQKLMTLASGDDFAGWNESTIQDAIENVSREQWMRLLGVYFGHYNGSLRFYVDSSYIFRKFMMLPKAVGSEKAQAYFKWYMLEILAMKVYAPWIIREFPNYQEALAYQFHFCFAIIEQTASYAFLAPYVAKIFTEEVKEDIRELLQKVRLSYDRVFADTYGLRSSVQMLPSYSNSTGRIFELLQLSDERALEENYAHYEDMTSDPLENWRRLVGGRRRSFWSSVSMGTVDTLPSGLLFYEVESISYDFSLRPDVAVLPAYDRTTPVLIKLASLGSLMASAMAKVLYTTQMSKKKWHSAAACILPQNSTETSEAGQIVLLQRVIAMAVIDSAARAQLEESDSVALPGMAHLTGMKLLYAIWCYQQCGEEEGNRLCNEPLREHGFFGDTFKCDADAAMRKPSACTAGWFNVLPDKSL